MSQLDFLLPLLKCPTCGHLDLLKVGNEFVCPACDSPYAVINDIPDFAPHVAPGSVTDYVQRRYDQDAAKYSRLMRHWILPLLGSSAEEMIALVQSVACGGGGLLEVPVGTADLSAEVYQKQRHIRVVGVDLAWGMLRQAQQRAKELHLTNLVLVRADVTRLPFKDIIFDALLTLNGLHIFPDMVAALENMQAIIKPGSRVAGSCPVSGTNDFGGWLMKKFQEIEPIPQVTIESMKAQLEACWPGTEFARSGTILTFKRSC